MDSECGHRAAFNQCSHSRVPQKYAREASDKRLTLFRAWSNAAGAWLAAQSLVCMLTGISEKPKVEIYGNRQLLRVARARSVISRISEGNFFRDRLGISLAGAPPP
jgi:hypothetical protein